jgi:putative acetyltransferase
LAAYDDRQAKRSFVGRPQIRPAKPSDARGILEAHHSAVTETAAGDYPRQVIEIWGAPVTDERVQAYARGALLRETTLVAEVDGVIAGFGVIIEAGNELRAVYVAHRFSGQGVGSALLRELEKLAREYGCKKLEMDSSLTAESFYRCHGFEVLGRGEHPMGDSGRTMACVRMRKKLE